MAPKNIGISTSNPTLIKYETSIGKIFCESIKGMAILQAIKLKMVGTPNKINRPSHLNGFILFVDSLSPIVMVFHRNFFSAV